MFAQSIGTTFTWCGNHVGLLSHYSYTGFYTFEIQVLVTISQFKLCLKILRGNTMKKKIKTHF